MKGLIALVVTGLVVITAYTVWADHHKADRRSRLDERAAAQARDTLAKGRAADTARHRTDQALPPPVHIEYVRTLLRDTVYLPALPDRVGVLRTTLATTDSTLAATSLANMLLKEERRAQDDWVTSLSHLAETNRALYLNEQRRNFVRRGFYAGVGVSYGADGTLRPALQVGYGFSVKWY